MEQGNVGYFEQRERSERAAAQNASSMEARRVHEELADNYAQLAREAQLGRELRP